MSREELRAQHERLQAEFVRVLVTRDNPKTALKRRLPAGLSTPNRSPIDLSLHPTTNSSASGAVFRPCTAVFGVPSRRKKGV